MKDRTKKIAKFVNSRKESLLHKETVCCLPTQDKGVLSFIPRYIPVSYQGTLKSDLMNKLKEDFTRNKSGWKKQIEKIWENEIEVIIVYKLGSKYSNVDVDNLNKFMIDSMKGILFKDDKQVKLVVGRKDKIDEKYLRGQYVEKAIVRIDLFKNSKINVILKILFHNPSAYKIPENQ